MAVPTTVVDLEASPAGVACDVRSAADARLIADVKSGRALLSAGGAVDAATSLDEDVALWETGDAAIAPPPRDANTSGSATLVGRGAHANISTGVWV